MSPGQIRAIVAEADSDLGGAGYHLVVTARSGAVFRGAHLGVSEGLLELDQPGGGGGRVYVDAREIAAVKVEW